MDKLLPKVIEIEDPFLDARYELFSPSGEGRMKYVATLKINRTTQAEGGRISKLTSPMTQSTSDRAENFIGLTAAYPQFLD